MIFSLIFAAVGSNSFTIYGQDELRNSVYGNKKNAADSNKSKSTPKKKNPPPVAKNTKRTPPKANTNATRKNTANNSIDVTFVSREPSVEVYLNEKNIGVTDETFQLSKKLTPGDYLLMAKNKRQVLLSTKKISVNPEQTSFKLYEEIIVKPPPPKEKPVETEEQSEAQQIVEISQKVKQVLLDYVNPATTDAVTIDDWQIVFQAAQLGQLQDYTAVQIEAQRWFATGQIELSKKEYTNAFTAFTKAIEFMPSSALPYYGLGNTYFAKQQYLDAAKMYQKAALTEPKFAMAYKRLGDALRLQGKSKEAINAYKSSIKFGYNTVETRLFLGTLMLETKQIEEALEQLESVAKEMPKAEVFITIGNGYEKLKRDVSAIEAYQKAIDADPNSALAYYKLAEVYLNQREYPKAKEAYEKALSLDADGKTINRNDVQRRLREAAGKSTSEKGSSFMKIEAAKNYPTDQKESAKLKTDLYGLANQSITEPAQTAGAFAKILEDARKPDDKEPGKNSAAKEDKSEKSAKSSKSENEAKIDQQTEEKKELAERRGDQRGDGSADDENEAGFIALTIQPPASSPVSENSAPPARQILHVADLERIVAMIRTDNFQHEKQVTINLKNSILEGLQIKLTISENGQLKAEFLALNEQIKKQLILRKKELSEILRNRSSVFSAIEIGSLPPKPDESAGQLNKTSQAV